MREGAGLACWLLAEKQHVLGGGLATHQVIRIKAGERSSLNTPARNSPHCYFPTPGSRVPEQYFSNFSCTRVTWASCSNADSDSMGQGWAQIPHFVPAPRLADAAVHGPHRSREGPEDILAWPGCLFHQEPSLLELWFCFPSHTHRLLSTSQMGTRPREANEVPPGQSGAPL